MHYCANIKLVLLFVLGLLPCACRSNPYASDITHAELALQGQHYVLSAQLHYNLSEQALTALKNGVPLLWTLHIKIKQRSNWFWDSTIQAIDYPFRIQHHALLNQYRFSSSQNGTDQNFSSLSAAMDLISNPHNLAVIDRYLISDESSYYAELKLDFESDDLPLPLRPIAAIDPQWSLSSPWTVWPLKK